MTRLKRALSYVGIFVVTMCMAAGFVILQFLFSNKNSTPNLVVGAEDTTFSQVINKIMDSDNISAEFDVDIVFGEENLNLSGLLELDLAKILNAGDDILGNLEFKVDCDIESDGEVVPLAIKVVDGMCYATVANNQLKFEITDTIQNIGVILALAGVEISVDDLMSNIDMTSLMGLMENVTTENLEDCYEISIPLFDYGTAVIIADKEYNITEIKLDQLSIEGVLASVSLKVQTNKENFEIPVTSQEEDGLDVSNLMRFVNAGLDILSNKQVAGDIVLKTKHFENEFDFGVDFNNGIYAYLNSNILDKKLQILTQDNKVYLAFNDFKFKSTYNEIASVVMFVKDYVETLTNVSVEEEVNNEIENIQQTNITLSDILEKFNLISVDLKDILNGLSFEDEGNKLVFNYEGLTLVAVLENDKLDAIEASYDNYSVEVDFGGVVKQFDIDDAEYVDYTFYQSIYNRISDFIESKKAALTTTIVLGASEYKVDIKVDLNHGYDVEFKTTIGEFDIKLSVINNILYLQVNEQKVSYSLENGESLTSVFGMLLSSFDFSEYEDIAQSEIEKLTVELCEMLNQILNITEEQAFEILSYFALNYVNNNTVDIAIDDYRVSFAVANGDLLNVEIGYKDIKVMVDIFDKEWSFDLNKDEYVAIDKSQAIVSTIIDIINTRQIAFVGEISFKQYKLPLNVKLDFIENYAELSTKVLGQDILLVLDNGEVFAKLGNIKVRTNIEEIESLGKIILGLVMEETEIDQEYFANIINEATNSAKDIKVIDILKTLKLSSDAESITAMYDGVVVSLIVVDNKLGKVSFAYDKFGAKLDVKTEIVKTEIVKENYVEYTHFVDIYNRFKNLIENKKFELITTIDLDEEYVVNVKADLNSGNIELNTIIKGYIVRINLSDDVIYLQLNNQKVSYKLNSVEELAKIVSVIVGEENLSKVENELSAKIEELKSMLEGIKQEFDTITEEEIVSIFNSFEIDNIYNNGVAIIVGDIKFEISVCEEDLLIATVNNKFKIVLSDKDFTIELNKDEYVAIDNINAIVNTVVDIANSKQITLTGSVSYKEVALPLTLKLDFNNGLNIELNTTISGKEVMVVYDGESVYIKFDELRFKASNEDIKNLIGFVFAVLSNNGFEFDTKEITNIVNDLKTLTLTDVLNGFVLSSDENSFSVKVENFDLTMFMDANNLTGVKVETGAVEVNATISSNVEFTNINKEDYVNYEFYKAIIDRISDVVKNKKAIANLTVSVGGNVYELIAKVDLSNGTQIELSTTIDEYAIQINLIDNVLYVRVNEQKLSYTLPNASDMLKAVAVVLNKVGVTEEKVVEVIESVVSELDKAKSEAEKITEEQIFDILNMLAINSVTNNKVDISYDNIRVSLEICKEEVSEFIVSLGNVSVNLVLNDSEFTFNIIETEYTSLDNLNYILPTLVEVVNTQQASFVGEISYKQYKLPVNINLDLAENYAELSTKVLGQDILVVLDNGEVFAKIGNIKVRTDVDELNDLYELILDVLSQDLSIDKDVINDAATEITNSAKDIKVIDILKTLKLSSDAESITAMYDGVVVSLIVVDNKLGKVSFAYDKFGAELDVETEIVKTEIDKENYVSYMHFVGIYDRFMRLVENKKFELTTTINIDGEEYIVYAKADLSEDIKIELNAKIKGYDISVKIVDNMLYLKLNNQKISYALEDIDDLVQVLSVFIGEENVKQIENELSAKIEELKSMLEGMKQEFDTITEEEVVSILNSFDINNIYNNGVAIAIGDINFEVSVCEENLLVATVNYNNNKFEAVLSDSFFEVVVENKNEFVNFGSFGGIISAAGEIKNNKQIQVRGELSYKGIILPVDLKASFENDMYIEFNTTISGKEVMVVYDSKNVYIKFDELRFKASNEDIGNLISFVTTILEENNIEFDANELTDITSNFEGLNFDDILANIVLSSDETGISVQFEGIDLTLYVEEDTLTGIYAKSNDIEISADVYTTTEFTRLEKTDYVNYEFYKAIVDRISEVVKNKKAIANLTVSVGGNVYELIAKVDLSNGTQIELSTTIDEYAIQINLIDNVLYVRVNEQKLSYTLPSVEDIKSAFTDVLRELDIEDDFVAVIDEMLAKVDEAKNQVSTITEDQIFDILNMLAINSVTNNKIDITYDNLRVCLNVCENEVVDLIVEINDIFVNFVTDDKAFTFDIVTEEYTTLDGINSVVNTIVDVVENRQLTFVGEVTYKTLTLPLTVKLDLNETYIELSTTVLQKDILVVYTNDTLYLTVDNLKVKATNEEIVNLVTMLVEVLNSNGANIDIEGAKTFISDTINMLSTLTLKDVITKLASSEFDTTDISLVDILSTLKLTNEDDNNLTIRYNDVKVSLNQSDARLNTINFKATDVNAAFMVYTSADKETIVDSEFATVSEIEAIYNDIKAIVDAKAFNIVADFKYGDYDFDGNISVDLSDINNIKVRIYNAYFNEYKIDITYIDNVLYAKINELKVYLAVDLDNIQDVLDKVGYAYNNFTNSELDIPNIEAMIEDYKQMFEDMLSDAKEFSFEDFMDIYNKITLNEVSKFKVDCIYDNIKAVVNINTTSLINAYVEYEDIIATIDIDEKQTAIYVPDLTDYSNLNPVIDILGKVTDTFSTKKFGLSTTIEVMGEKIGIVGYADLSDFENGPKVFATATIANTPVYITYFEEVFYFEVKGLKMSATLKELQQLFEVDIKKFIETTLDDTLKGIEDNLNGMLESLDILDSVSELENGLKLCTSMGLDLTFVENSSKIESIVVDYADIGLNATLNVLGYAGTISKPAGEFTTYENGIKLATTLIDFATNETFNVAIDGTVANEALDFVFDINQKDAYITSINAKGTLGTSTKLQIGYLGEEKYIVVNGNKVYDYTEEQANANTIYTDPSYLFVDYNGLKIKLDTLLIDKIVGFITGLFNIDLSVVYDLLNLNIPSYDMEVMQGLVTGYDTEVKLPVDENSGLEETLNLLESISLSMDGTTLIVSLTDGGKAIVKTEVVDGVTRLATLELIDIAMGEDKLNLAIDFYCELPSDMANIPSKDDASYMDLSTIGNFLETLVDTVNFKRYKIQGVATIVLGDSATLTAIDVFADIQLIKTEKSDGTYVWKPYIVAWLKNLPDSNDGIVSSIAIEKAARENDATNHQTRLYIDSNGIYVYRTVYKYVKVQTGKNWLGLPTYENVYGTHVLSKKKFGFDAFSSTDGMVDFMNTVIGLSNTMEWVIETAFKNPTTPDDYSPEKMFYNDVANNKRSYVYNGRYNLLFNGKYLLNNSAIGDLSVDIGTEVMGDGNDYLSNLNFTMNASIVNIKLSDTRLIDYISHSSYPTINADIGNELAQLKNGTTSFEAYFNALAS